ncbi:MULTISPECIES: hypothetical protein [Salipiger]|uniref:hypothetical protein n=2 Tax=Roseobacteraceae TaxID=2854170 RepID=UPI0035163BFC
MTTPKTPSEIWLGQPISVEHNPDPSLIIEWALYVQGLVEAGINILEPADLATTAPVTLAGEQTIDGTLTSASRVLVKDHADAFRLGVWITSAGAWTRASDADTAAKLTGALVPVLGGVENGGTGWRIGRVSTIGVDPVLIAPVDSVAAVAAHAARGDNPHGVTAAQVGAVALADLPVATDLEIENGIQTEPRQISPAQAQQAAAKWWEGSVQQTKFLTIETGATADQTGAEIKAAYEAEADTNAFTDAEKTKLSGVEAGADVSPVASVAGKTGAVSLGKADVGLGNADNTSDADKPVSTAQQLALDGKASAAQGALADSSVQPGDLASVATSGSSDDLSEGASNLLMTAAERSKLGGVEAGADVSPVASVAGKTGAVSLGKADVGLGSADNTSDADKPVSTAARAALDRAALIEVSRGELREMWTHDVLGEPEARDPIAIGTVSAFADFGSVLIIDGSEYGGGAEEFVPRVQRSVEPGRVYRARYGLARVDDPLDPSGHAIRLRMMNYDASKDAISNITHREYAGSEVEVGDGAKRFDFTFSLDVAGVDYTLPAATRYVAPFFQLYGNDHQTALAFALTEDVTDAFANTYTADDTKLAISENLADLGNVATAKSNLGLGSVDNTADADKPVSTAQQAALDGKSNVGHSHTVGEIPNLTEALDARSMVGHTHTVGEIPNLTEALNDRARLTELDAVERATEEQATHFVTGTSEHTAIVGGVIPLLMIGDEIVVWLDMQGVLHAPGFTSGDSPFTAIKDGIAPLIYGADDRPIIWFDAKERRVRSIGDDQDWHAMIPGAFSVADAGGARVMLDASGELLAPSSHAAPTLYTAPVDDGGGAVQQVFVADGASARRLTASRVDCHAPQMIAPGLARYARADGRIGLVRVPMGSVEIGGDEIIMLVLHGQSLAVGSTSYDPTDPIYAYPASDHVLMFNGGVRTVSGLDGPGGDPVEYDPADYTELVPAYEVRVTSASETGLTTEGFSLSQEIGCDVLVQATGVGGVAWDQLNKGTVPWTNMLYGVTRGKALADAAARPFSVPVLHWQHGESQEDATSAEYRSIILTVLADFVSDVVSITGQSADPIVMVQQINRMEVSAYSGIAAHQIEGPGQAVADLVQNPDPGVVVSAPQYVFEFGDDYHMLVESYVHSAAYDAKALRRHLYQDMPFRPLFAESVERVGKVIDVTVAGGWVDHGGAITIDTSYVTDPGMFGVVYADDTMSAAVARVEVTGRNRLTVWLTEEPTGATRRLGFAYFSESENDDQGRETGLRCCIRDNDPDACPVSGLPLHNYMISHTIGV